VELIELGRREPGKLSYGSAGTGSPTYLGVRMIEERSGARFVHVPYKGVGPAYQDLLGGQIQFMFPDLASALPHIRSGRIIPIATERANSILPAVATIQSQGWADFNAPSGFALVAPSATPPSIIERISREAAAIHRAPEFVSKVESMGLVVVNESQPELVAALKKERADYGSFIRRNAIVATD
jgi:tripartite-type tricarboxylate transporter receptor subunit TctC